MKPILSSKSVSNKIQNNSISFIIVISYVWIKRSNYHFVAESYHMRQKESISLPRGNLVLFYFSVNLYLELQVPHKRYINLAI